jgi:hypothetical protein
MLKHNKKRNTLAIYEQLVSLVSKLTLLKRNREASYVVSFIKEHFNSRTEIGKEYKLLDSVVNCKNKSKESAEKILEEALKESCFISSKQIEKEKSKLINDINKKITSKLYDIPLKNYKIIASTQILFNEIRTIGFTTPEERVKIKSVLTEGMTEQVDEKYKIDNLTFKILINNFNKRYSKLMNEDQKSILSSWALYVINENAQEMSSFLNEKISFLKEELSKHIEKNNSIKEVYEKLLSYEPSINEESVYKIMRYYDLLESLNSNEETD